jgi:hypothetical protein
VGRTYPVRTSALAVLVSINDSAPAAATSVLLQWVIIMWSGLHLSAIAGLGAEGGAVVAEACRLICSETVSTEEVQVSVAVQPRAPVTERL